MKVLAERDKFLSDFEVLEHLKTIDSIPEKKKKHNGPELEVVTKEILKYMAETPCVHMNQESLTELMGYLNSLELVKIEKLQIVNSLPRSVVHLYSLVDEFDSRFNEDVCNTILEKINTLFPLPEEPEDEEEEEEQEQQEEQEEVQEEN